jgi:penicillin-binding protein 2
MQRDNERHKQFSRRAALLAGGQAVLISALVGRMYFLQVIESKRYKTLADENRVNFRLLAPLRGRIVDRFGVPIADNQQNYRVLLIPERTDNIEITLLRLGSLIPISKNEKKHIMREVHRKRSFVPVTLRENLSWEDVARIEVNTPDLPGIIIDVGQSRFYPYALETAHVLGYVAAVSEGEATGDPLLELPGFRIGKSGVEKVYDLALRGTSGSSQVEVNAFGRVIRELERNEGQPGTRLQLTIDTELQKLASEKLRSESGSVVVMDIHSGDVLAMVSTPGYDPNAFNKGLSAAEWNALISNDRSPLINKTIGGHYAPGSTFKMVVALAALEKGVISSESEVFCSGETKLGNATFHCWKRGGHGITKLKKGISQSCDVYFYEIAKRTGIERIAEMARRFGLGTRLGLDLPGEKPGLIPSNEWKKVVTGTPWQQGETLLAGIGQGYVLTTPLQLAVMTARLVNGGVAVTPRLTHDIIPLNGVVRRNKEENKDIGLIPAHLALVREAMNTAVNVPGGTAFRSRIKKPEFRMGGKTGTAQVRRISKLERETRVLKNSELPWKVRDHALFVGFAPVDSPRYAISVVVEHGGGGSKVAAPIARDVLEMTQRRNAAWPAENQSMGKSARSKVIALSGKDESEQGPFDHGD